MKKQMSERGNGHGWALQGFELCLLLVLLLALGLMLSSVGDARGADGKDPAPVLTPEERARLEKESVELSRQGGLLQEQGEYGKAMTCYQQALEMCQQLYPKEQYPQGHPELAISLNNLGELLKAQGEYGKALSYHQQALEM